MLWRNAKAQGVALEDALAAWQTQGWDGVKTGRPISATSGGGYSVSFDAPQFGEEVTRTEFFAFSEELFHILDDSKAALIAAGTASPDDEALYTSMMASDYLQGARELQRDYTLMRWPSVGFGGSH